MYHKKLKYLNVTLHLFICQDSNGRGRGYGDGVEENLHRALNLLEPRRGAPPIKYNHNFYTTYHLRRTYEQMLTVDHTNAIVVINVGVNNVRWGKRTQWTHHGIEDRHGQTHHGYMKKIVDLLKEQTHSSNIIILQSAPSTKYSMENYNKASQDLSQREEIIFAPTLVNEQHLWNDGYHIHDTHRHLLVKSVAAAIVGMNPFKAFGNRQRQCS